MAKESRILLALTMSAILLAGCASLPVKDAKSYSCPDGREVSNPGYCATPTPAFVDVAPAADSFNIWLNASIFPYEHVASNSYLGPTEEDKQKFCQRGEPEQVRYFLNGSFKDENGNLTALICNYRGEISPGFNPSGETYALGDGINYHGIWEPITPIGFSPFKEHEIELCCYTTLRSMQLGKKGVCKKLTVPKVC